MGCAGNATGTIRGPTGPTDSYARSTGSIRSGTGDIIVADADGVVVVPFDMIDTVIARLGQIREMETKLDAEVAEGRIEFPHIPEMLAGDQTRFVE